MPLPFLPVLSVQQQWPSSAQVHLLGFSDFVFPSLMLSMGENPTSASFHSSPHCYCSLTSPPVLSGLENLMGSSHTPPRWTSYGSGALPSEQGIPRSCMEGPCLLYDRLKLLPLQSPHSPSSLFAAIPKSNKYGCNCTVLMSL